MGGAAVAAAALVALTGGGLQRVDPATLRPEGPAVRVPSSAFGFAWARRGGTVAIVTKPRGGIGFPVRVIRLPEMTVAGTIDVGARDICGLTFRGATLVALASDRLCYQRGGSFSVLRIDLRTRKAVSAIPVPALHVAYPTNLAFGDNSAFVTHAGGGVDVVNLSTGVTTAHTPRRTLAKGEGVVATRWLGRHLLGAGKLVVDVRTWRARALEPGATGIAPAGARLVAYGPHGIGIYTRSGRLLFRALRGVDVRDVHVSGRYLEATEDSTADIVDLRTRRETLAAADPNLVWGLLAG